MSIWTNIKKYASQLGFTYNGASKTYNEEFANYSGKLSSIWTQPVKN